MSNLLSEPGRAGSFGAILDETARAAEELCSLVESLPPERYLETRKSSHPEMVSIRRICIHCVNCAFAYSNFIRTARGRETSPTGKLTKNDLQEAHDLRAAFQHAFAHTEESLQGFWKAGPRRIVKHTFVVPWGATYDPETVLEHGLAHILRHRRQIERW